MQITVKILFGIGSPFILIAILMIALSYFMKVINKMEDKLKSISFESKSDYYPKKVKQKLEDISKTGNCEQKSVDEVMKAYNCLFYTVIFYFAGWIIYVCYTVYLFVQLCHIYNNFDIDKFSNQAAILIMQVLLFYWFFLTPIFQAFRYEKLIKLGKLSLNFLKMVREKVKEYASRGLRYFLGMVVTSFLFYRYFFIIEKVCRVPQENPFVLNLMLLMLYQYVILKLLIFIPKFLIFLLKLLIIGILKFIICPLKKILLVMSKKIKLLQQLKQQIEQWKKRWIEQWKKWWKKQRLLQQLKQWLLQQLKQLKQWLLQYFEKYSKDEILYLTLKNYTYLSMVLIYTVGVTRNYADSPRVMALGTLFLVDVFLAQDAELQKRINKSE